MKMKDQAIMLENYKELQRQYTRLLEDKSFRCPKCFEKLVFQSDYDMNEVYADDQEGVISVYTCNDCRIEVEVSEYYDMNDDYEELKIEEGDIPF